MGPERTVMGGQESWAGRSVLTRKVNVKIIYIYKIFVRRLSPAQTTGPPTTVRSGPMEYFLGQLPTYGLVIYLWVSYLPMSK